MRDYIFFDFIFSNYIEYLTYCIIICFLLYLITRKYIGSIFDPFHFYYTFTFGTSYAVILTLFVHGYIDTNYFLYLFCSGMIFVFSFVLTTRLSNAHAAGLFYRLTFSISNYQKLLIQTLIIAYLGLLLLYLSQVPVSMLLASRFEANKGLGIVVRIMDALRLIIAAWLYAIFIRTHKKKFLLAALIISIIGAFSSGAKFALLEQIYVMFVAGYISERKKFTLNLKTILISALLVSVMFFFIAYLLTKMSATLGYSQSQYINGVPAIFELFLLRIIANGDSYYLSLTQHIIDLVNIEHPFLQFLSNTFGNSVMSNIFQKDFSNNDIGRQIWLYWYPNDEMMRGPTAHFDLAGYSYFGYIGGVIFSSVIGCILGRINAWKFKYYKSSFVSVAFVAAIYCRSLALMLNPSVGFAYIVDIYILLFGLLIFTTLCKSVNKYEFSRGNRNI